MQRRSRHTIESTRELIATLRDKDPVYKTEVDNLKQVFSRAFEADWDIVKQTKHLNVERSIRSESDTALYFEAPFEARHWYGKKFSKILEACPESDFKDATVTHRNRWRPLFNAMQDLIKRQVKGRRPSEKTKKVIGTRTQLRATCPCCFKDHAVKDERLVAHGYTLDYGFQNGTCLGAGQKHFGTVEGVQYTQELIRNVRNTAASLRLRAEGAEKGEVKPIDRKTRKTIENPTAMQVRNLIAKLESEARSADYHAEQMQKMVDGWKFADPREVEVEITE